MTDKKKSRRRVKHLRITDGPMKPMPFYEHWVGMLTGRLILWLSIRAAYRRDWHEFNHLNLALLTGNSGHSEKRPCSLPHPQCTERPLDVRGGPVLTPKKDDDA